MSGDLREMESLVDGTQTSRFSTRLPKLSSASCSSFHILNSSFELLLSRDWRGEVSGACLERLIQLLTNSLESSKSAPVVLDEETGYCLLFIAHNDIFVACTASSSSDKLVAFTLLHKLICVFSTYFESFVEESVRDNFVIIYELLDEVVDNGYPQLTEPVVLGEFIKVRAYRFETLQIPSSATNAVSIRKRGILYKKNEIFLDVIEKCSLFMDASGRETRSSLMGTLTVRSHLSGMPTCQLSLNDRTVRNAFDGATKITGTLEDVNFHPCVDLNAFRLKNLICFSPPDGKFELLTYRTSHPAKQLVHIHATSTATGLSIVEYAITLSTLFKEQSSASVIQVNIPVASDTTSPEIQCSHGAVVYRPEGDLLVWTIRNAKGKREFRLHAKLHLPSTGAGIRIHTRTPVQVNFEIPYNTASGLQVKYLKVIETEGYTALPWVRYITRSDEYVFRFRNA